MARNQAWQKQEDGTMLLLVDDAVPDVYIPLTIKLILEVLDGTNISAMTLSDIISANASLAPHTASDVDLLTSFRVNTLFSLATDDTDERINKTIKQLLFLGFAHEVRMRVLEGKATTAPDRTKADSITTNFITFVTTFRTIHQEGEDYKTAQGF